LIYLDNHSTTKMDPVALEAMLPWLQEAYANPGSVSHAAGREAAQSVEAAVRQIAQQLGAAEDEIVITSGATESNNLALFGVCLHPRQSRRKIISLVTEHRAILDPLARLKKMGFEIELLPVLSNSSSTPGLVDLQQLAGAIDSNTALVSIMLANNEIGTLQPLDEIAKLCRQEGCLLHTDATQAVGRLRVDVDNLDVDLLSFSAHKFYGPKGVGGLFVRRRERPVRLQAQIVGGGQQHNFRSGTLNAPGMVGMAAALNVCLTQLDQDQPRIADLRNLLYQLLSAVPHLELNGPRLDETSRPQFHRLPGNLNCCFYPVEGQSLMLAAPELAVSSGSACTSAEPGTSHVLRAIGLTEEQARSSLRFGIGRFNTRADIEQAAAWLVEGVEQLTKLL
jgi:cysteine desulfurase